MRAIAGELANIKHSVKKIDFSDNRDVPAAGWKSAMQSLRGGAAEELIFRDCDLDEEMMIAIAGELANIKHSVKKIDFSNNPLPAAGWKSAMQSLQGGAVEELIFDECDLDEEKMTAIAGPAAGWKSAMQSLQGGAAEELIFRDCDLTEEKMTAIGSYPTSSTQSRR
eukprot:TRINITY_DN10418_c0_g1_i23.p1 TRINITY_DN10418_c0_g1~~TRINITY_DN10418_c0_g1_i23.p1  ORF type:complete len:167 (-),score=49.65 TRINITY_DN10418_c0_g1_i23:33-533(-)